jgi:predicted MPP superfamily phosphohydrolase
MMPQLLAILIWVPAGVALFVFVYGRFILHLRNTQLKFVLILISLSGVAGLCFLTALLSGWSAWLLLPGCVLLAAVAVEVQRLVIRHRCRASKPVEARNTNISLFKPFTTLDLAMRRYDVRAPGWRGGRLRVAQISDLHVHSGLPMAHYHEVMDCVRGMEPDLLLITGDFLTQYESLGLLADALSGAAARLGVYGILGNHDHWEGGAEVSGVIRAAGIRLLGNGWERVDHDSGVILSGCEEPWGQGPWQPPPAGGDPVLVLTHTADNIYRIARTKPLAVFAGHYHGGQAVLPGWGPIIIPSRLGRRFTHGHFALGGTHLFVTAGVGAAFPPVRIFCKPEVLVVDFCG